MSSAFEKNIKKEYNAFLLRKIGITRGIIYFGLLIVTGFFHKREYNTFAVV